MNIFAIVKKRFSKKITLNNRQQAILAFEERLSKVPGAKTGDAIAPLKHTFLDGSYMRQITMPKGMLLTSKIHKIRHPYKGD